MFKLYFSHFQSCHNFLQPYSSYFPFLMVLPLHVLPFSCWIVGLTHLSSKRGWNGGFWKEKLRNQNFIQNINKGRLNFSRCFEIGAYLLMIMFWDRYLLMMMFWCYDRAMLMTVVLWVDGLGRRHEAVLGRGQLVGVGHAGRDALLPWMLQPTYMGWHGGELCDCAPPFYERCRLIEHAMGPGYAW